MLIGAGLIIATGDFDAILMNFEYLRTSISESSDVIVSIATALAALFIIFNMIKIAYDLFSDEQSGGLGGVSVKQILIPIVLLFLLQGYGLVIKALDGTCNSITKTLVNKKTQENLSKSLMLAAYQPSQASDFGDDAEIYDRIGNVIDRDATLNSGAEELIKLYEGQNEKVEGSERSDLKRKYKTALKKIRRFARKSNKQTELGDDGLKHLKVSQQNFWQNAAMSVYAIIQCYLEIILCLMVLLGPFTLAFSILSPWKHSFITFIGKYIEISFSKVVASFILWISSNITGTIAGRVLTEVDLAKQELISMVKIGDLTGVEALQLSNAHYCNVVIWLAAMVAFFAVPAISSNILNLAAPNMSGSEKAGGLAGGMTKSAGGLGSKAASMKGK